MWASLDRIRERPSDRPKTGMDEPIFLEQLMLCNLNDKMHSIHHAIIDLRYDVNSLRSDIERRP